MEASLLIRLIDQVTGPAGKVRDALKGVGDMAGELKRGFNRAIRQGFSVENIETATRDAEAALSRARSRLLGAVGMGLALAAPLKGLGDFEDRLVDFGNVAGIYGDNLKAIESELRAIGPSVNKSADEMLASLEYLVGKGIDPTTGLAMLRAVGMTASATKSDVVDMSASGFAAVDNLGVATGDLQLAFDAMAAAGKRGGFELRDMARYFPELTASARMLRMDGVDAVAELAAALQVAMKGTSDPGTAANNMQNFLSKLTSPETVKRFKEMGINIEREFEIAAERGISVFEHMLGVIEDVTGGDQFKIGELFGDMQVLNFLKPMMANLEEFRAIRDEAMKSAGVNEQDFTRVMETATAKAKALAIELNNLLAAGSPLLEIWKELTTHLLTAVRTLNQFVEANPELARNLIFATAAMMGLSIASRLLGWALAGARLGLINFASFFLKFNSAGRNIATGWRIMATAGRLLWVVISGLAWAAGGLVAVLATISAPVWAVIAALTAAAFALWKYWDAISAFAYGFASVLLELSQPLVDVLSLLGEFGTKATELAGVDTSQLARGFGLVFNTARRLVDVTAWVEMARSALDEFGSWMSGFFSRDTLTDDEKSAYYEAGRRMAERLVQGIKDHVSNMIKPVQDLFNFTMSIDWPEPPAWLSWLIEKGGGLVDGVSDTISGKDDPTAAAGGGGGPRRFLGDAWDWVTGAEQASDRMVAGAGVAGDKLGGAASEKLNAGAAAAGAAFGNAAVAVISKARVGVGGGLSGAISAAKTAALHGGTE